MIHFRNLKEMKKLKHQTTNVSIPPPFLHPPELKWLYIMFSFKMLDFNANCHVTACIVY